ncbi:Cytochrome b5 [Cordyceps javanica]|uniref:Cytochrome b5 n=1 Tax=Cordyceps javanica TaxID=43265 RepID=A0A545V3X7_9HYPO|nr:Cytochrome b5 [Cordyceps javanica]
MGLIGFSLIVASVVYVLIRPPSWLPPTLLAWLQRSSTTPAIADGPPRRGHEKDDTKQMPSSPVRPAPTTEEARDADRAAMPPPPPPPPPPSLVVTTTPVQPLSIAIEQDEPGESPTTPKATAMQLPSSMPPPPTFSLSTESMPPPSRPTVSSSPSASSMMPPPPLPPPPRLSAPPPPPLRPPTLGQFPAVNSAQRARGPPSRQVTLEPGHSPLDWARISGGPGADLRGVPASTPYLRVTPSMLRRQTGRRGTDAWMALNGKVYNVTPYAKFHPGGVPELMRGAARDGTRLFGEVHPWVNYENMLTACLVGIMVDEPESTTAGPPQSEMEAMD